MKRSAYLFFIVLAILFLANGCGYKPSAKYARKVVGEKVSTSVVIAAQDPENTVIMKDAIDLAIIEVFHASLTDTKHADTHLKLQVSNPVYTPIQYNSDGYVVAYRATTNMQITRTTKNSVKRYHTQGTYDFAVSPNAVITDQERFDAIKYSSAKAIASFLAHISAEGSQVQ